MSHFKFDRKSPRSLRLASWC